MREAKGTHMLETRTQREVEYNEHRGRIKHLLSGNKETNGDLSTKAMEGGQCTHFLETRKQVEV